MLQWFQSLKPLPNKRKVEAAYRRAERASRGLKIWKFGVCNGAGELIALIELTGDAARDVLIRSMRLMGFGGPVVLGKSDEMKGCDFLYDCA